MRRLAALTPAAAVVVVLGAAQLVLPGIAAQRLRDQPSRSGQVLSVQVFSDPRIRVRSVGGGDVPGGFAVRGAAVLTDSTRPAG